MTPHNRLALGAAQFGFDYGIANATGQPSLTEVTKILDLARSAGLDTIDTAVNYGNSEFQLGRIGANNWKIISKLPALPKETTDIDAWVETEITGCLNRLKIDQLDAILLHRPNDILGSAKSDYCKALHKAKDQGLVQAVGYSITNPTEINQLWPELRPDIIQAPYNVIDRRLADSGCLKWLKEQGVRVHVRSVFLQGLLLMPAENRPTWFQPWNALIDDWFLSCEELSTSPLEAALAFALEKQEIERVVIGVDSSEQLGELLSIVGKTPTVYPELSSVDPDLIDPSRWKLQ